MQNGRQKRRPNDVLWDLRTAHAKVRRTSDRMRAATAEHEAAERALAALEAELRPLMGDCDLKRWTVDDGVYIEAGLVGEHVATELIEPEDGFTLEWPEPEPELDRRLSDLASVSALPPRVADAVTVLEDDGETDLADDLSATSAGIGGAR